MNSLKIFDKEALEKILPHKYPAQMLDGIIFDPSTPTEISGYKTIEDDEIWLRGHFPDKPIFPGHCLEECAFLTALALVKITMPEIIGIPMIAQVGKNSFSRPALIGDRLEFKLTLKENRDNYIFTFDAKVVNQRSETVAKFKDIKGVNNKRI